MARSAGRGGPAPTAVEPLEDAPRPPRRAASGSAASSSEVAARSARTPPNAASSRFLRAGPEARDPVEHARGHPLAPALPVEGDGEAVGLVADPLQQVEGLGAPGDPDRLGVARAGTPPRTAWPAPPARSRRSARATRAPARPPRAGPCPRRAGAAGAGRRTACGPRRRPLGEVVLGRRLPTGGPRPRPARPSRSVEAPGEHLLHGRVVVVARDALRPLKRR